MSLAMHRGLDNIVLESDSLQIISVLQRNTCIRPSLHSVENSKAMLFGITGATVAHARRQANEAAHH